MGMRGEYDSKKILLIPPISSGPTAETVGYMMSYNPGG
jgi:hypothetical protein